MNFWSEGPQGVLLVLHISPNAPKSQVIGRHGDALKVKIKAPPVDGKANQEIIRFFAELLGVSRGQLEIVSGDTSKSKRLRISGVTWDAIKGNFPLEE